MRPQSAISITTASEMMNTDQINDIESTINDSELTSVVDQSDTASIVQGQNLLPTPMGPTGKFKLNATPFSFVPVNK